MIKPIHLLPLSLFLLASSVFADTFRIAVPVITPFNPISNEVNSNVYVGYQLYYPLFNLSDDGSLESHFLNISQSKSLDTNFNKFTLCLKSNLHFSDGTNIESQDLSASLATLSNLYPHLVKIAKIETTSPSCILFSTTRPTPNLFRKLTGLASTVLKKSEVDKVNPVGFGPYKIQEASQDRLGLVYLGQDKPRFDKIEFQKITHPDEAKNQIFQDFNSLPARSNFVSENSSMNSFNIPSLKVYSLVLNLPTESQRQCLREKLAAGDWNHAYGIQTISQKSFLPWHRAVAEKSSKVGTCHTIKQKFDYIIADSYDAALVQAEIKKLGADKFLNVHVLSGKDFVQWVFSGKPYIGLISFDSTSSTSSLDGDFSDYFESFVTPKNRIISTAPAKLASLLAESTQFDLSATGRQQKTQLAEAILLDSGWVLPIGRLSRNLIFPIGIKISSWDDNLNGFPTISKIQ